MFELHKRNQKELIYLWKTCFLLIFDRFNMKYELNVKKKDMTCKWHKLLFKIFFLLN